MKTENTPEGAPVVAYWNRRLDLEQFCTALGHEAVEVHKKYLQLTAEMRDALNLMKEVIMATKAMAREVADPVRKKLVLLEQQLEAPYQDTEADLLHQPWQYQAFDGEYCSLL